MLNQLDFAADDSLRRRFSREVEAIQRVAGRCTARLIDADLSAETPWLATEFVDGPTLGEYVRSHGPLAGPSLSALALGLLEALSAIHSAGVVHRDLKPSNVILASSGPKVVDFGIAHYPEAASAITATGAILGTPAWMSPEQVDGRAATPASDVFAWGSVVAFAGVGRSPFGEGRPDAVVYRVVHADPDLTGLPNPPLDSVRMALRKEVDARPTVSQLAAQLGARDERDLTEAADITLRDQWTLETTPPIALPKARSPRRWAVAAGIAALLATAVAISALALAQGDTGQSAQATPQTKATPTTTAPSPTTTPAPATAAPSTTVAAPSAEDLWSQNAASLAAGTGSSSVVRIGGVPLAATALGGESRIWEFRNNSWQPLHDFPLPFPNTLDLQVQAADVTGDGIPEFIGTFMGASRRMGVILSNTSGTWREVPFDSPNGDTLAENPIVQGNQLISYINTCEPYCAAGNLAAKGWTYDTDGGFFRSN